MKVTKNYWIGICMLIVGLILIGIIIPVQHRELAYNAGLIAGVLIGTIGIIIMMSGIILEEK
jgi:hypothetical protein